MLPGTDFQSDITLRALATSGAASFRSETSYTTEHDD